VTETPACWSSPRTGRVTRLGRRAVASDDLACGAAGLAGAVRVDGQLPAELVQQDVVVPVAAAFEVDQAGGAAVGAVDDMVRFAGRGGLVAAAGVPAALVAQRDQPPQVDGDVVGLGLVRVLYLQLAIWALQAGKVR
jgi:hypothetical protein